MNRVRVLILQEAKCHGSYEEIKYSAKKEFGRTFDGAEEISEFVAWTEVDGEEVYRKKINWTHGAEDGIERITQQKVGFAAHERIVTKEVERTPV